MPVTKAQRHRRPAPSKNRGPARRLLRSLPKQVEQLAAVQQAAEYIDDREAKARRSAITAEKAVRAQIESALRQVDPWLGRLGLMRLSRHDAQLRRARAKKPAAAKAKKRTSSKTSGSFATA